MLDTHMTEVCMAIVANMSSVVRRIRHHRHAWHARLRRERAAVALLVLLTLGLGEPLLCILHCQIWLPIAYHSYFAAQHRHDHQGYHAGSDTLAATGATAFAFEASIRSSEESTGTTCFMRGGL